MLEAPQILCGCNQEVGTVLKQSETLVALRAEQATANVRGVVVIDRQRLDIAAKSDGLGLVADSADALLSDKKGVVFIDSHPEAPAKSASAFFVVGDARTIQIANSLQPFWVRLRKVSDSHFCDALFAMLRVAAAGGGAGTFKAPTSLRLPRSCQQMIARATRKFRLSRNSLPLSGAGLACGPNPLQSALMVFKVRAACGLLGASAATAIVGLSHFFENVAVISTMCASFHAHQLNASSALMQG